MTDFDSHHIGLQQPQSQAHQETDTHLHDQPAPDVISTHHTSTFAAPHSPVHSPSGQQQPAAPQSFASTAAAESSTASTQQQQTEPLEAPLSSIQHTINQTGTAALPHSNAEKSAVPATAEHTQQQPSTFVHDASTQQPASTSDSINPSSATMSQQPQAAQQSQAAQQPVLHARGDTPSFPSSSIQHTDQTGTSQSEGMSVQTKQHQQEPEMHSAVSTPADATARVSEHVDDASGRRAGQAEQTGAGSELNAVDSAVSADREEGLAGSAAAAQSESQQADGPAATSHSQQEDAAQQSEVNLAPDASSDANQPPELTAQSSSAHADQQRREAERGAGFPAGPAGKTTCSCSLHTFYTSCKVLRGLQKGIKKAQSRYPYEGDSFELHATQASPSCDYKLLAGLTMSS